MNSQADNRLKVGDICASDPILANILKSLFGKNLPFQCLPRQIDCKDADSEKLLEDGFKRLFHCEEAEREKKVVLIWVLEKPYTYQNGKKSTVVRIDQTENTIKKRWASSKLLAEDHKERCDEEAKCDFNNLEKLAKNDCNWSLFQKILCDFGPLRIWYSNVEELNNATVSEKFEKPQEWEKEICNKYKKYYDCTPLKDKNRCG